MINKQEKIAIRVEYVSKMFKIPHEKHTSLKSAAINLFSKKTFEKFDALQNINFEIKKGEFFGIIGRNGSGKSTLLKILAGIYIPTNGKVVINGKLSPFLELGVGFNPELTGSENLFLGGAILGLSREDVFEKFDKIVKFAELEEFIDTKLKNYSSGMQVRLAFSLAISAHAEILLMDEVLAVGDTNFQAKCIKEFINYKKEGKTVVLVTHDLSTAERYCDRLMYLESGKIVEIGRPSEIVGKYMDKNLSERKGVRGVAGGIIKEVSFRDKEQEKKTKFKDGESFSVRVDFDKRKLKALGNINFGVAMFDISDQYCFGTNTIIENIDTNEFVKRGYLDIVYTGQQLLNGEYFVKVGVFGESDLIVYDFLSKSQTFNILTNKKQQGITYIEHEWR